MEHNKENFSLLLKSGNDNGFLFTGSIAEAIMLEILLDRESERNKKHIEEESSSSIVGCDK